LLAEELNLNIEEDADELINLRSPTGSRQILRKYNVKHEYVPFSFSDLTTPMPNLSIKDSFPIPTFGSGQVTSKADKKRQSDNDHSEMSSSSFCSDTSSE
jgi:hypothetical protein